MKILCEYCQRPNSYEVEVCQSCGAPLPIIHSPLSWSEAPYTGESGGYSRVVAYMGKRLDVYSVNEIRGMYGLPPMEEVRTLPHIIGEAGMEVFTPRLSLKDIVLKSVGL